MQHYTTLHTINSIDCVQQDGEYINMRNTGAGRLGTRPLEGSSNKVPVTITCVAG